VLARDDAAYILEPVCWTVGRSLKDAASEKSRYMVELSADLVPTKRQIYAVIWAKAAVVVKELGSHGHRMPHRIFWRGLHCD
jgi:hypothetical protein